jgi:hypothetical protein
LREPKGEGRLIVRIRLIACVASLLLCNISSLQAAQVLFTPGLVLSEEYTDNLFLDSQDEEQDFTTTSGVDLTGQILWRTAGIELRYNPTYEFYQDNDDLNSWRHEAGLYTWKQLKRGTRIELRDTYLRSNDPADESAAIEQDGQPQGPAITADPNRRGRREYYTNTAEARINHQFGASDHVYVAYQYSTLREEDTLPGTAVDDNDISTPSIGLAYNFSQRWGVEIDSSYAMTDYKERNDRNEYDGNLRLLYRFGRALSCYVNYRHTNLDFDQDTSEDYSVYEPSVGIHYDFPDDAYIEIGAGYYVQDFETSEDQEGVNITSDISKTWLFPGWYLGLSGGSGYAIDDNGVADNGLEIYYQGRLEVGYNFAATVTGSVYGAYRYDEYPSEVPERVQKSAFAGAALNWQALNWMHLRLTYGVTDVSSDIESDEYTENRAMITIRMVPSSPFRLSD